MRTKIYSWILGMGTLFTLAACSGGTSTQSPAGASNAANGSAPSTANARCNAQAAQSLVGQTYNDDVLARVYTATGAQEVRLLRPDSMVTKEFKMGRANVVVDAQQRVVRVHCG